MQHLPEGLVKTSSAIIRRQLKIIPWPLKETRKNLLYRVAFHHLEVLLQQVRRMIGTQLQILGSPGRAVIELVIIIHCGDTKEGRMQNRLMIISLLFRILARLWLLTLICLMFWLVVGIWIRWLGATAKQLQITQLQLGRSRGTVICGIIEGCATIKLENMQRQGQILTRRLI